ncbi:MAG: glutaredoxin domain-containing protein [Candidatus Krumholzibacteria bacterium]|jgi:glutaredoxin-like YruB-family protein|nr:glutaredoxin domain-containing protein [Candidatus Krumholzibacteria bacterium]MDP6668402.1 glutaredoxin domain-containing protein [Candidatus Krumholzibacteria bacterium]MDP6797971.1 glutaredoxin domain-containing protein [Candidatus Krumholzibacteria bacterium]MDP7021874.1 glutaredoxin domain-containing protein [Candidatus Krumholzibacteria bacterium]
MESAKRVIIFSTPTCSFCRKAKSYLKEKGVRFKEIDVSRDLSAVWDMERRSGQRGVPVIMINNRPVVGFDTAKINRLLGLH